MVAAFLWGAPQLREFGSRLPSRFHGAGSFLWLAENSCVVDNTMHAGQGYFYVRLEGDPRVYQ